MGNTIYYEVSNIRGFNMFKRHSGFSLMEILITIAIIAVISVVVIVALNPTKIFEDGRNSTRQSNIASIYSAINSYISEEGNSLADFGAIPTCATSTSVLGTSATDVTSLVSGGYIGAIPVDPEGGTQVDTGYTICSISTNKIKLLAPSAEGGSTIVIE